MSRVGAVTQQTGPQGSSAAGGPIHGGRREREDPNLWNELSWRTLLYEVDRPWVSGFTLNIDVVTFNPHYVPAR